MDKRDEPAKVELLDQKHDLAHTVTLGMPTHLECLEIFKELGENRSMPKIIKYLENQKRPAPALTTIKKWSMKYKWTSVCRLWDLEIDRLAQQQLKESQAKTVAEDLGNLAKKMRGVSHKMLNKLSAKIDSLKISTGGEAKAVAEAAVALNKAAEVLDGGVSDRTESVSMTAADRKNAAHDVVNQAFRKFSQGGQDNGKRNAETGPAVDDATNAGRSAGSV